MRLNFRVVFLAVFAACLGLMAFGLYLQHFTHIDPCPLCILQRYAFVAVGFTALAAAAHNPGRVGRAVYGVLLTLFAVAGAAVAVRNVWLQHLPPGQVPECGAGLDFMLQSFPLTKALPMLFEGSGDCAKVAWTFLGLSIPEWALICFVLFAAVGVAATFCPSRRRGWLR